MADKPILFSAPMVRALLNGTKTQTRRVIKNAPGDGWHMDRVGPTGFQWTCDGGMPRMPFTPPIAMGDRLYVREGFSYVGGGDPGYLLWRADDYEAQCDAHRFDKPYPPASVVKWKPGIHMPRAISRITLEVYDVKVQRLQNISEADAVAEGCRPFFDHDKPNVHVGPNGTEHQMAPLRGPAEAFARLWDSINGAGTWDANPWVVAYSFTVERGNIDQLGAAA